MEYRLTCAATEREGINALARMDCDLAAEDVETVIVSFDEAAIGVMLTDFGSGFTDWNDQLIVESCRHHCCKLLTNDSDHTEGGIEILTTHPRLLRACPS